MGRGHQIHHTKEEPGACEGGREEQELVSATMHVNEGGPQVLEVETLVSVCSILTFSPDHL